jgi:hypothetical protein
MLNLGGMTGFDRRTAMKTTIVTARRSPCLALCGQPGIVQAYSWSTGVSPCRQLPRWTETSWG